MFEQQSEYKNSIKKQLVYRMCQGQIIAIVVTCVIAFGSAFWWNNTSRQMVGVFMVD